MQPGDAACCMLHVNVRSLALPATCHNSMGVSVCVCVNLALAQLKLLPSNHNPQAEFFPQGPQVGVFRVLATL